MAISKMILTMLYGHANPHREDSPCLPPEDALRQLCGFEPWGPSPDYKHYISSLVMGWY